MMVSLGGLLGLGSEYDGVRRGWCTNWSLLLLNQDLCTVEGDTMSFGHTDGVGYGQSDFKAILGYDRFVCLCLLSRLLGFGSWVSYFAVRGEQGRNAKQGRRGM